MLQRCVQETRYFYYRRLCVNESNTKYGRKISFGGMFYIIYGVFDHVYTERAEKPFLIKQQGE